MSTKNFGVHGPRWIKGKISSCNGPLSYEVTLTDGRRFRRHVDHIQLRQEASSAPDTSDDFTAFPTDSPDPPIKSSPPPTPSPPPVKTPSVSPAVPPPVTTPRVPAPVRRSQRNRRPNPKYTDYTDSN